MPVTGYDAGGMADAEARVVRTLRGEGVSVEKVHRIWTEEDYEGFSFEVAIFVSEAGRPMTARIWPSGEAAVEEGW